MMAIALVIQLVAMQVALHDTVVIHELRIERTQ